mmetsp:Transcript_111118/g.278207  ORF Transcript_111118/g.278207 Transcript_111118/m.278207 type:complete len:220 (+) Transcript_111118:275-934(+)
MDEENPRARAKRTYRTATTSPSAVVNSSTRRSPSKRKNFAGNGSRPAVLSSMRRACPCQPARTKVRRKRSGSEATCSLSPARNFNALPWSPSMPSAKVNCSPACSTLNVNLPLPKSWRVIQPSPVSSSKPAGPTTACITQTPLKSGSKAAVLGSGWTSGSAGFTVGSGSVSFNGLNFSANCPSASPRRANRVGPDEALTAMAKLCAPRWTIADAEALTT